MKSSRPAQKSVVSSTEALRNTETNDWYCQSGDPSVAFP
jgi:hypothetical protein